MTLEYTDEVNKSNSYKNAMNRFISYYEALQMLCDAKEVNFKKSYDNNISETMQQKNSIDGMEKDCQWRKKLFIIHESLKVFAARESRMEKKLYSNLKKEARKSSYNCYNYLYNSWSNIFEFGSRDYTGGVIKDLLELIFEL